MILRQLLFCASLSLLAANANAAPVTIKTSQGDVSVEPNPDSLVVMDIAAIDTIDALGVTIDGAPGKLFVDYLDDVAASAKPMGSLHEPDYRALSLLKPELIIVGGRSSGKLDQTSKIAPSIDMTLYGDNVTSEARERLSAYGKLFEKETEASALLKQYDDTIAALKETASDKGNALVIMTNGPKVSAYGSESRFGWLYSLSGLPAASDSLKEATHGDAISFEFILEANPDWLLVIDRGAAIGQESVSAKATLDNELIHKTKAWQQDQIIYLNSADIYIASGGIQSQMRTINQLKTALSDE